MILLNLNVYRARVLLLAVPFLINSCRQSHPDETILNGQLAIKSKTGIQLFRIEPDSSVLVEETSSNREGKFTIQWIPRDHEVYLLKAGTEPKATLIVNRRERIQLKELINGDFSIYEVKGSYDSEIFHQYLTMEIGTQIKVDSLKNQFKASQGKSDFFTIRHKIDSAFQLVIEQHKKKTLDFIKKNRSSLASALILNRAPGGNPLFTLPADLPVFIDLNSSLRTKYAHTSHYKFLRNRVEKYQEHQQKEDSGTIGSKAADFKLPDISGTTRSLSGTQGKVKLLLFWTSWQPECRSMNILLSDIYLEFKAKGLEIISVSADTDLEAWKDAIRKDKAYWIQLHDNKSLKSEIIRNFGVRQLPTIVIMNEEGIILHKNTGISGLRPLLRDLLAGS